MAQDSVSIHQLNTDVLWASASGTGTRESPKVFKVNSLAYIFYLNLVAAGPVSSLACGSCYGIRPPVNVMQMNYESTRLGLCHVQARG